MAKTRRRKVREEDSVPEWFSDVPISSSTVMPDAEVTNFGGFAWTGNGIMVAFASGHEEFADNLDWVHRGEHWVPDETETA